MNVKHYINENNGKIFNIKETKKIRNYFLNIMLKTIDPLLNDLYKRNNITNISKKLIIVILVILLIFKKVLSDVLMEFHFG